MSAFDDEFGLFGDEEKTEEEERTSTLGARKIASEEAAHDDIEPEDERPRRERGGGGRREGGDGGFRRERRPYGPDRGARSTGDPAVAQARAVDLLGFLAKKLVSNPDEVIVEAFEDSKGPVIELVVNPDDLGKVIGRGGRVAQALRTLTRASAEGRVTVDIVDTDAPEDESGGEAAAPEEKES